MSNAFQVNYQKLNKTAFSLLEIIIVVVIISIISSVGIYKLFFNLDVANMLQLKTQISLIQSGITKQYNENILLGKVPNVETLDDKPINTANELLFTHILNQSILSSSETKKEIGKWIKTSSTQYKVFINNNSSIAFQYNSDDATFDCNHSEHLCEALYQ